MKPFIVVDGVCYISETEIKRAMSGEGLSGDSWKLFKDGNYELTSTAEAKATLDRIKEAVSKAVQAGYQLITKEFKGNQYAAGFALNTESSLLVNSQKFAIEDSIPVQSRAWCPFADIAARPKGFAVQLDDDNQTAAGQETTQRNDSLGSGASPKQEMENDPYPGAENVLELLDWIKRQVSSSQLSSDLKSKL